MNVNCSISFNGTSSKDIHLEAPHLSDKTHSNRARVKPLTNANRRKTKPKIVTDQHLINPCNGSYVKTNGTTCGLKEIMLGRCQEYQYVKRGLFLTNQTNIKNCTQLYEVFELAVRYKSYCNLNMSTYERYFDLALEGIHVINRAMFWSGTYAIAHTYSASGRNYVTLEDTLAAAMVDGLLWCGKENDTEGFDFFSCPYACKDNKWADLAFWGLASKTFAQLAAGEIYVILNGSQANGRSAFRNHSYFSSFELPNLRRNGSYRVTKVNALVLHSPDQKIVEKCGEKSLLDLEKTVQSQGFDFACKDDPEELILIMCSDKWDARECQIARQVLRQTWNIKLHGTSNSNRNSLSLIAFLCLFLIQYYSLKITSGPM
ncbi:unnamed protein product [Rotaria sp. Silwood1]|nr:unnamed protein product [Rotaria sp. Silwood1]CAF3321937.1 unnamed protein product [Rotaria sp. Silwood1]CAF3339824.1 unnamed protein product [Rotaria sp. Silwood1]CAF3344257.1 unnamed protein product [Rotaria sp. Silwood1]CAF4518283.1 unnamed protein product [Rotaria sp. Silwood1]